MFRRIVVALIAVGFLSFPVACQQRTRETKIKIEGPEKEREIKIKTTEKPRD